jgi:membrane-associated phospholipid phosphatase
LASRGGTLTEPLDSLRRISVAAAAATVALAAATRIRGVQHCDEGLERLVGRLRPRLRGAARIGTLPGEPWAHPAIGAGVAITILVMRGGRWRRVLVPLAGASVGAILAHHAVKAVYRRGRPAIALRRGKTEPAFPSGHTTDATAVLATGAYLIVREGILPARVAIPAAAALALSTGASRIALGWHWGSDVVGGWLAGGAVAAACAREYERLRR